MKTLLMNKLTFQQWASKSDWLPLFETQLKTDNENTETWMSPNGTILVFRFSKDGDLLRVNKHFEDD